MKRKTLGRFGRRGDQVRALLDRVSGRVEVHYRDRAGLPHKKIFEPTKAGQAAALAWAEAYHIERSRREAAKLAPPDTTMRHLWQAYTESPAFRRGRAATQRAYRERFGLWMAFMGEDALPGNTTLADVDRFMTRMESQHTKRGVPKAINQVRQIINAARTIYRWGLSRKLIAANELAFFRWQAPKDTVPLEPEEYSNEEYEAMLVELPPQHAKRWRANVAVLLGGASGQRVQAIRHLRWADVDWSQDVIVWPAKYQKQGVPLERAITPEIRAALLTAWYWRQTVAAGRVHHEPPGPDRWKNRSRTYTGIAAAMAAQWGAALTAHTSEAA